MSTIAEQMQTLLHLFEQVQPLPDDLDVVWAGPYYIPRRRIWYRSRFTLWEGQFFAALCVGESWESIGWRVGSDEVEFQDVFPALAPEIDAIEWMEALKQIETRLRSAIRYPDAYNRRVTRLIPPQCRTGAIERRLTWPADAEVAFSIAELDRFQEAVDRGARARSIDEMTLKTYLDTVALAYDAVFPSLRPLSAIEKYKRLSDGRHGGLLDLSATDALGFASWSRAEQWFGSHPWEIVYGNPRGIVVLPVTDPDGGGWRFRLSVDTELWYPEAARMSLALADRDVPFTFPGWKDVQDALAGVDNLRVGPEVGSLHYDEIAEVRPDSLAAIRWDAIPELGPITAEQAARVRAAERDDAPQD